MAELTGTRHDEQRSRGYAVIINNRDFRLHDIYRKIFPKKNIPDPTRYGAGIDDSNLQFIFGTKLNFQFLENRTFKNVNKSPYKTHTQPFWIHDTKPEDKKDCKCMSCKIQSIDHSDAECFVLAISTHGVQVDGKQEICFSDDLFANRVTLSDVIKTLNDDNCKTLVGKPRIIILSMCRSDPEVREEKQDKVWHDAGHNIGEIGDGEVMQQFENLGIQCGAGDLSYQEGQSQNPDDFQEIHPSKDYRIKSVNKNIKADNKAPDDEYYYGTEEALMNLPPNFLIVFPSVAGKKTFHNKTYGSWLIDELAESVEGFDFSRSPNMNFLSVLTETAGRVARDRESEKGKKTAVCIVHRLLEPIIFKAVLDKDGNKPSVVEDKPAL
ncbi:uncharacterized protein LOC132724553 [Ruditapes philippinarum]|uniref:uncharacterized protein LOC132724553 n=1 Tax=Ruditapes philippinarum TaxID=129788 RepID=UPI00295C16F2|nr:uncharacterized protein LOC132724553 [Ruditapes philippinarum]XP_060565417.1 uncharacterized protein LOC132724553 [Ruditapes philippinarum]